jgi:hypothetical protein
MSWGQKMKVYTDHIFFMQWYMLKPSSWTKGRTTRPSHLPKTPPLRSSYTWNFTRRILTPGYSSPLARACLWTRRSTPPSRYVQPFQREGQPWPTHNCLQLAT